MNRGRFSGLGRVGGNRAEYRAQVLNRLARDLGRPQSTVTAASGEQCELRNFHLNAC